jgi:hypothetical protein
VVELHPDGFTIEATGDFAGRGVWTFVQEGPWVRLTYDWRVRAGKPLLRYLSFLLKPIFSANHRWAMAQGEKSLRLELARRRATTEAERARIPPPPAPATSSVPLLGTLALLAGLGYLITRRARSR